MVPVRCRTNDDRYEREEWPTVMLVKPAIGESVESKSGKRLKIASITHKFKQHDHDVYLEIELGKL